LLELSEIVAIEMAGGRQAGAPLESPDTPSADTPASETPDDRQRRVDLNRLTEALDSVARASMELEQPTDTPVVAAPSSSGPSPSAGELVASRTAPAAGSASAKSPLGEMPPGAALLHQIGVAARACRRARCPLSLLLIQLDGTDDMLFYASSTGYTVLCEQIERCCRAIDHHCAIFLPNGTTGGAIVLPNCDRSEAVRHGNHLAERVQTTLADFGPAAQEMHLTVAIGAATVALPPKNFAAEDLHSAAARCLYASSASGGVTKSIEIY
jgi:GGDEF domain-containing protein